MNISKPKLQTIVCSLIVATLFGCNSSNSNVKPNSVMQQSNKPKANYVFNKAKKDELLVERNEVIQSSSLTFSGETYSPSFATVREDNKKNKIIFLLMKSKKSGSDIVLQVPRKPQTNDICRIYTTGGDYYEFDCSSKQVNVNGDMIYYSGLYTKQSPQAKAITTNTKDFTLELHQYLQVIGSTQLNLAVNGSVASITTSNPYRDFGAGIDSTDLGVTTYTQLEKLLIAPVLGKEITLVFDTPIDGSSDDDINMYTGLLIQEKGLHTKVSKTGSVFSGGTDLFTAGKTRTLELNDPNIPAEKNKQVGVHSWSEDDEKTGKTVEATNIPYTNESHRAQATYFQRTLGDKGIDFYLFTLKSAPAEGAHYMTRSELESYRVTTNIQ